MIARRGRAYLSGASIIVLRIGPTGHFFRVDLSQPGMTGLTPTTTMTHLSSGLDEPTVQTKRFSFQTRPPVVSGPMEFVWNLPRKSPDSPHLCV